MLFQPSNIYPSTLSGIGAGTVDVTQGLNVSWQVNGDTPMTAYRIRIYQNDSGSTLMYDSGSVSVSPAFETHDKYGNPTFYTTLISAASLSSAGIVNGYQYGYKMLITQWWGVSDYVEQTSASVFITRSLPTISIDAIANPVTSSSVTITATYAQAQGDPISTVEWVFAMAGSESNPIKRTGAVNTQILSFDADGLITGNTYSIMCNVVTANGMETSTGFVQFSVSYPSSSISVNYQLAQMKNSSAVYLSWDSFGANVLSYPYEDSTKTTNGITFTVNGEGNISASGTASADAYFDIAEGTISDLGLTEGNKLVITSGYSGAKIVVTETNSSNVVVSTITGSEPLQYIVPSTTNTLTFSVVIPSGTALSPAITLSPMLYKQDDIVAATDVIANITPIQSLNGYSSPWPAGGGKNLCSMQNESFTQTKDVEIDEIPAGSYTYSAVVTSTDTDASVCVIAFLGANSTVLVAKSVQRSTGGSRVSTSFTVSAPIKYIRMYASSSWSASQGDTATFADNMIESGSTPTSYTPYSNICPISGRTGLSVYVSPTQNQADATTYSSDWTSVAGTVYGGSLDVVTGVLTVTHKAYVFNGTENGWSASGAYQGSFYYNTGEEHNNSGICSHAQFVSATSSYAFGKFVLDGGSPARKNINVWVQSAGTTVAQFKTWLATEYSNGTPLTFVLELATPLTYQLTQQQVTLLTTNNIWADSGDVSVSYTKSNNTQATVSGAIVTISDSKAVIIPTPVFTPGVTGVSIYRYMQGESILHHIIDVDTDITAALDYFAPSQQNVSYLLVAHSNSGDLFMQTNTFTPVFWFYSILLCSQDSNGIYHVSKEYVFKYGVETGAVSNNNSPTMQTNFTPYPNRQPISSLYKTGKLTGYIGKVDKWNRYSDSVSLQNAIYDISVSTLTKFLKSRKGDVIMADTSGAIQMQTEDRTTQQALKATVDWAEVGDASQVSIVSIPTDPFWPM